MRKILLFVILTAAAMSQAIASERIAGKPVSEHAHLAAHLLRGVD